MMACLSVHSPKPAHLVILDANRHIEQNQTCHIWVGLLHRNTKFGQYLEPVAQPKYTTKKQF